MCGNAGVLWFINSAFRVSEGYLTRTRDVMALRGRAFQQAHMELAPLFSPMNEKWARWKMRYYAPFFKPLRHVPLLNELFVHRIVLDITK
jgi:hypothetical protein